MLFRIPPCIKAPHHIMCPRSLLHSTECVGFLDYRFRSRTTRLLAVQVSKSTLRVLLSVCESRSTPHGPTLDPLRVL